MLSDTIEKIKEVKIDPKSSREVPFVSRNFKVNEFNIDCQKRTLDCFCKRRFGYNGRTSWLVISNLVN